MLGLHFATFVQTELERLQTLMGDVRGHQHGVTVDTSFEVNIREMLGTIWRGPSPISLQFWLPCIPTNGLETSSHQASSGDQRTPLTFAYVEHLLCPPSSKHPYKMVQTEPETYPSASFSFPSGKLFPTWPTRAATRVFCLLLELASLALFLSVSP